MIVNPIKRRPTRKIRVGSVYVGGDAPISIQSMTNTETCDVAATVAQIQRCADAGADIMRVSVPTMEAAAAFGEIRKQVTVPLVADIHFDYKIALAVADFGADCLRINPGNIGSEAKIREVVAAARHHDISMRIGVNAGSLEKDIQKKYGEPTGQALLESAMRHIDILDRLNFQEFKISVKASLFEEDRFASAEDELTGKVKENIDALKITVDLAEKSLDYVTRDLIQEILEKEEEYWDWLDTQLDLIENVGIENYIQSQI